MDSRFFADLSKQIRQEKGFTQEEFGNVLGLRDRAAVTQWETGKSHPKDETLIKLAAFTRWTADELINIKRALALQKAGVDLEALKHVLEKVA